VPTACHSCAIALAQQCHRGGTTVTARWHNPDTRREQPWQTLALLWHYDGSRNRKLCKQVKNLLTPIYKAFTGSIWNPGCFLIVSFCTEMN